MQDVKHVQRNQYAELTPATISGEEESVFCRWEFYRTLTVQFS